MGLVALLGFALVVVGLLIMFGVIHTAVGWVPLVVAGGIILFVCWWFGGHRLP